MNVIIEVLVNKYVTKFYFIFESEKEYGKQAWHYQKKTRSQKS